MEKNGKTTLVLLLSLTLLLSGSLQTASAVNLDALSNYSIRLSISPYLIEEDPNANPYGYIYLVNRNGVPFTPDSDVEIALSSDNSLIASVPEKIIFPANDGFTKFEIKIGNPGVTTIIADLNGRTSFTDITVGVEENFLPDALVLELNVPTTKMHVNSDMPFSVYMRTSDGEIVRAPFDVEVILDYEKQLATPNTEKLIIKKGENYAWGTIHNFHLFL